MFTNPFPLPNANPFPSFGRGVTMTGPCPIVRIKSTNPASQGAWVEINLDDFRAAVHELYEEPAVLPPPPVLPPAPPVLPPAPVVVHPALANLPRDWRDKKTAWLRELAEKVSGRTPENRDQAIQMIESTLSPSVASSVPVGVTFKG